LLLIITLVVTIVVRKFTTSSEPIEY